MKQNEVLNICHEHRMDRYTNAEVISVYYLLVTNKNEQWQVKPVFKSWFGFFFHISQEVCLSVCRYCVCFPHWIRAIPYLWNPSLCSYWTKSFDRKHWMYGFIELGGVVHWKSVGRKWSLHFFNCVIVCILGLTCSCAHFSCFESRKLFNLW